MSREVRLAPDQVTRTVRHLKREDHRKFIVLGRTVVIFYGLSINLQLR
jgi:hypothetical protein